METWPAPSREEKTRQFDLSVFNLKTRFAKIFANVLGKLPGTKNSIEQGKTGDCTCEQTPEQAPVIKSPESIAMQSTILPIVPGHADPVTGLDTLRPMAEKYRTLLDAGNTKIAIGIANIDGMRPVNELYGKAGGDEVLRQCGLRFKAALCDQTSPQNPVFGHVYRYDADQFAFLLISNNQSEYDEISQAGKILRETIAAPVEIAGTMIRISCSIGFALADQNQTAFGDVLRNAEIALYDTKRNQNSNGITLHDDELDMRIKQALKMEQALRNAISQNRINPHFQPIISLQEEKLLGFEALARWDDPELGTVPPDRFIPLAEQRGIITQLTDSLLLQAAKIAAQWPDELFLSFNVSGNQLADANAAKRILQIIAKTGLAPERLEIEITETAVLVDPKTATGIIEELRQAGIRIAMDDFGTGQSSLGRLRELKLDKVKIDRSFINELSDEQSVEHIVRAILQMCAGLDLAVVAEGIEQIDQANWLKDSGCQYAQGFLFGKPQNAKSTTAFIKQFQDKNAKVISAKAPDFCVSEIA